jgi:4'-phosphopantetheinyl transferase
MSLSQYIKKITPGALNKTDVGNKVDMWKVNISDIKNNTQKLPKILSGDEVKRASKYRLNKDKIHFIISRTVLRTILSSYVEKRPEDIIFSYTDTLKPVLNTQDGGRQIYFNVSHSNGLILYAVCRDNDIGIDVECLLPTLNSEALAKRFFSLGEREYLISVPPEERWKEFTKIWVIKEAYLKATAKSISNVENVEVVAEKNKSLILKYNAENVNLDKWKIYQFELERDYVACVVYK